MSALNIDRRQDHRTWVPGMWATAGVFLILLGCDPGAAASPKDAVTQDGGAVDSGQASGGDAQVEDVDVTSGDADLTRRATARATM